MGLRHRCRLERRDDRPLPRARRELHRHGQHLHQGTQREDPRGLLPDRSRRRPSRSRGHRHQVRRQPLAHGSQRRRKRHEGHDGRRAPLAAAPADRLHRPPVVPLLGSPHPHRGTDARDGAAGAAGQGAAHRPERPSGVGLCAGAVLRAPARRHAAGGPADRIQPAAAHRGSRAHPDGHARRHGRHALEPAPWRRPQREVQPGQPPEGRWQHPASAPTAST